MDKNHISAAIDALRLQNRIFHSEADFQFSFAWELQKILPDAKIRLEYCPAFAREMHIDIFVSDVDGSFPIELKYKSRVIETILDNEYFYLKTHGAQDIGRYDFLYDISRIEYIKSQDKNFTNGFAVILTNDSSYWKSPYKVGTVDSSFRIHEGRVLSGSLSWSENVGSGTCKGRSDPIVFSGRYKLHWNEFCKIPNCKNGLFKICVVEVA